MPEEESTSGVPPSDAEGSPTPTVMAEPPTGATAETEGQTADAAVDSDEKPEPSSDPDEARWQWLENVDPEELVKRHHKLAGKVGELAEKQAKKIAERQAIEEIRRQTEDAQRKAAEDDQRRQEEIDRLLETDQDAALEKVKELRAEQRHRQEEATKADRIRQEQVQQFMFTDSMLNEMFYSLPVEGQRKLAGKTFTGANPSEARRNYLNAITEELAESRTTARLADSLKKAQQEWEQDLKKNRLPAQRADVLAEINGAEPSPDLDGGAPSGAGPLTESEFASHRKDATWRKANINRIDAFLAQDYARKHGRQP